MPVVSDPLRYDPGALIDTTALVAALRQAIADAQLTLAPKVSVAVDGGGRLHLDALSADLRLRAFMSGRRPIFRSPSAAMRDRQRRSERSRSRTRLLSLFVSST